MFPSSVLRVDVGKRKDCQRVLMQGIFVGAKVQRGPDWDWGNQDGGKGKIGRVVDIRGWDGESGRSVANVIWASGITNVYRVGHKGKVDLTVATPGKNGYYYPEHLPVLGKKEPEEEEGATASRTVLGATAAVPTTPPLTNAPTTTVAGNALSSPATPRFTVGEKVHQRFLASYDDYFGFLFKSSDLMMARYYEHETG